MIGIYKITNIINGKSYIGLSNNILRRKKEHFSNYIQPSELNKTLYRAFEKYGKENFTFEILEECQKEELSEKEKFWIDYYNTYKDGYNETTGGECSCGEENPNHKMTENEIKNIRQIWASKTKTRRQIYKEFCEGKISTAAFRDIYLWNTWSDILPELNTLENQQWHQQQTSYYVKDISIKDKRTPLDKNDVYNIYLRRKRGEKWKDIYEDYKNLYCCYQSFGGNMKRRFRTYFFE